jgi:nickel-dependent lactate racemase
MTLFLAEGSPTTVLSDADLRTSLYSTLKQIGPRRKVIAIPPDITRLESRTGQLTCMLHDYYGEALADVMPALGTHFPMTDEQVELMYPGLPKSLIREHRWRDEVVTLGEISASFVRKVSGGLYDEPWTAQMNKLVVHGEHDLIISLGQVVPHEILGMANYTKNIFIGIGGAASINPNHYLAGLCGVETILGREDTPPRRILNEAQRLFCKNMPFIFAMTVIGFDHAGETVVRGLFIGDDQECFQRACALSRQVNITPVDRPADRLVAYLDPEEFSSFWLGGKAIYRTRMAIADGGELIILAPGVSTFGEDPEIDRLIRKYGYRTNAVTRQQVAENEDYQQTLGAAAQVMLCSPEDRFRITLCPGGLTREEVQNAGLGYGDLSEYMERYSPETLADGWNTLANDEQIYFVRKPALGLWALESRIPK